jgi:perosamine synthetase
MPGPLRYIAPAGAPIRLGDLAKAAGLALSRRDVVACLRDDIRRRFGVRHAYLTSTGRAGMTILLRALRRQADSNRNEVILPSYTCYSVAASVVKAGLRPRLLDIDPETLDYHAEGLDGADFTNALAIVACNLYGFPNDMQALRRVASRHGMFLVDDAAQAMGARVAGEWSGTGGDFGLFSLDKGKNVSAIDGGVVVTNDDALAISFEQECEGVSAPGAGEVWAQVAKALTYAVFLHPSLYWIPSRIPQLGLGRTVFTTNFPLESPSRFLTALGGEVLPRLEELTRARTTNATALIAALRTIPGLQFFAQRADASPVYLRLPVLLPDPETRDRALAALTVAGIGASRSYPASLADVPELRQCVGAASGATGGRHVAQHILTLPTHPFVRTEDISRTAAVLRVVLEGRRYPQASAASVNDSGSGRTSSICVE